MRLAARRKQTTKFIIEDYEVLAPHARLRMHEPANRFGLGHRTLVPLLLQLWCGVFKVSSFNVNESEVQTTRKNID